MAGNGSGGADFLSDGGELGTHMRAKDWSATPVGEPSMWPQGLRTAVRIMLDSRYAMWGGWGPDLTFFYNDAYARDTLGKKHPWALGRPAREVWAEIWSDISPRIERVMGTGQATWDEGLLLYLERSGYPEETYHTFSYSPLYDEHGRRGGMLCVVTEETNRVIAERRAALLRDLAAALNGTKFEADVFAAVERCLDREHRDVPFALTFLVNAQDEATLASSVRAAPLSSASDWPLLQDVITSGDPRVTEDLPAWVADRKDWPWTKAPQKAMHVPIAQQGQSRPAGVFVAGLNPHRPLDEEYRGFIGLFVGQIASALANAHAYEEERRRAAALAELDRAKTAFFSNVSHEFRTPLTLMLGPLEDLVSQAHGRLPPRVTEELAVVHRNGLRLLKLVNTLLDFSRIEAGRVQAVFEPTDLAAYTAELASVFRSAVERAGLRLIVDCPPLAEAAYVDRGMWEKVVLNLLSNAFKFTLQGEIDVRLRAADDRLELTVRDTGSGIPDHELPRLFERFHRVEGTKGRTHEGTGIGLALVQELVKLHGGGVGVTSQVDRGSTFTVWIPRGSAHLPPERINAERTMVSTALGASTYVEEARRWLPDQPGVPVGNVRDALDTADSVPTSTADEREARPRVVLADDNADMRDYVRRLLEGRYDVHAVGDGLAALKAVRDRRPDLVISDVMMPNLDGFGLLRELRADEFTAKVPVILLSARAGEEATLEGLAAGADEYLVKPFSARELLGRVAALLERCRFQRALAVADDHLRFALGSARMAAWEWDPEVDTLRTSGNVDQVFGLPPGGTLTNGTAAARLLHPDDLPAHRARIERAMAERSSFHAQFRVIRPVDGAIAWMEERGTARIDEATGRVRLTGVVMDVTDAKRAEQEREEILSRERAAREEAERASRLKEEFLTTLSHELRTPLNAIMGWAQILEHSGGRDPATVTEGLAVISRNARAQTQLIEDLLDMSRITTGKLRLEVQWIDLSDVVAAAIESVRPAADARDVRLVKVLDSVRTIVAGDPHRLQQVVWNLLSNAIKFTEKGGWVRVTLRRVNSHVELSVADNGQGIAPEFLPHVFERFRQADASTKRRYGGLGLGLSIVKQLVELHGGSVAVHSEGEGRGAVFTVELPVAAAHAADDPPRPGINPDAADQPVGRAPHDSLDAPPLLSLAGLTVLVLDDEPDARHLVKRILEARHATVMTADSGQAALELMRRVRPDVIVSDVGMPRQDGYEFLRAVRALAPEQGGQTPAIALTAYARSQDRRRALMAGYQSHVVKPVDPTELVTVVASVAGRLTAPTEAGDHQPP